MSLTSYSLTMVNACISIIAQRLNKTNNWVVALKTLMLIQRLLSQGSQALEKEIFHAKRKGTKFLNMCDFRDSSSRLNAWDYSAFVRTYALYLDENLEFKMQGRGGRGGGAMYLGEQEKEGGGGSSSGSGSAATNAIVVKEATPVSEMKNTAVFSRVHLQMQLLDRFLACRPTGAAKHNRVVVAALSFIVKESFQLFQHITEVLAILIDRFMQLEVPDMVQVHEIFSRISKQYDELDSFYEWCKTVVIVRSPEYPDVKKIPQSKLDMMEDIIHQKSAILQNRMRAIRAEQKPAPFQMMMPEQQKALPLPERFSEVKKNTKEENKSNQEVGDLLNLCEEDAPASEEDGDKLSLALFDDIDLTITTAPTITTTPCEAFNNSSGDWEMTLVQSASHFPNSRLSLPKGFDTYTLDIMYQQGAMAPHVGASSGPMGTGSASSVGSAWRPNTLALPAPPVVTGGPNGFTSNADPFAASLATAPPQYVQMSELEKRHILLVEEQLIWQHYAREGMQGHVALANVQQHNPYGYIPAGYTQTW